MIRDWKLLDYAMWAAKLLLTEMFVPGGTLVVLAILLASRSPRLTTRRMATLVPFTNGKANSPCRTNGEHAYDDRTGP